MSALSIKLKISALSLLGMLGMAALVGTFFMTLARIDSANSHAMQHLELALAASKVTESLDDIRMGERDFLFQATPDRIEEIRDAMAEMRNALSGFSHLVQATGVDPGPEAAELPASSEALVGAVERIISLRDTLGFSETEGLEGELRAAVHAVESQLNQYDAPRLSVLMLMMRRHEKDFMMREDPGYLERMTTRLAEFRAQLPRSPSVPSASHAGILSLMDSYHASFERYATLRLQIADAVLESDNAYGVTATLLDDMTASLEERAGQTVAAAARVRTEATMMTLTIAALVIALAGLLSVVTIRSIARGLDRAMAAVRAVASGDLSAISVTRAAAEKETKRGDEFAQLMAEMDQMNSGLRQLSDAARAIASGDLNVTIHRRSDADTLARSLEEMLAGLRARADETEHAQAVQERVVRDISSGLERLAKGDLTKPIPSPANDPFPREYEMLRTSFNDLIGSLSDTLSRVSDVSEHVRTGSEEITSAAQDLAGRAETQAATLEQSAAALNELTESVRSTAQRAKRAEQVSEENRKTAEEGAKIMRDAVNAMKMIEKSSHQINRIIGVIDDIAFQTNLLALNAGVEAARAGEAGRGFAVVASEVRGLAQRASESAREIKSLIQESTQQVETGSGLVDKTGHSLEDILRKAVDVSEEVSAIALASLEQSSGLGEINTGVNQLDQVTQQNAAVAEETNAAAASLQRQAESLQAALSDFQLGQARKATSVARLATNTRSETVRDVTPVQRPPKLAAATGGAGRFAEF